MAALTAVTFNWKHELLILSKLGSSFHKLYINFWKSLTLITCNIRSFQKYGFLKWGSVYSRKGTSDLVPNFLR